ncbi:hypothetical protein V2I01_05800 [Micromonospora sp. BRA006-A]|nr:hypothetical protein [Micromonospora sp. BRA006-A]
MAGLLSVGAALLAMPDASLLWAVVTLAALCGHALTASGTPRVRWAVAVGAGLFALVAAANLLWHRERVADGGEPPGSQAATRTYLVESLREGLDRQRLTTWGLALGVLLLFRCRAGVAGTRRTAGCGDDGPGGGRARLVRAERGGDARRPAAARAAPGAAAGVARRARDRRGAGVVRMAGRPARAPHGGDGPAGGGRRAGLRGSRLRVGELVDVRRARPKGRLPATGIHGERGWLGGRCP